LEGAIRAYLTQGLSNLGARFAHAVARLRGMISPTVRAPRAMVRYAAGATNSLIGWIRAIPRNLYNGILEGIRARVQIYVLVKDTKWMIGISVLVGCVLAVPDQVLELYRTIYSDNQIVGFKNLVSALTEYLILHGPVVIIATTVWFGTYCIVSETRASIPEPMPGFIAARQAQLICLH
jgi:hypothetical protein